MTLLTGLTETGVEVPVQVLPDGRLVAEGLRGATGPAGSQGQPGAAGPPGPPSDAVSFRNVLINGGLTINQRNVSFAAAAVGNYFADRWKKTGAATMTQIVEGGNFRPGATYTLSGTGVTTVQLVAPSSGNWTLPDLPSTATFIQLEEGVTATAFELKPIGAELALCQRYFRGPVGSSAMGAGSGALRYAGAALPKVYAGHITLGTPMRVAPTVTIDTPNISYFNCSGLAPATVLADGVCFYVTSTAAGGYYTTNWTASFDAEL